MVQSAVNCTVPPLPALVIALIRPDSLQVPTVTVDGDGVAVLVGVEVIVPVGVGVQVLVGFGVCV
jgi:hypothetical protein